MESARSPASRAVNRFLFVMFFVLSVLQILITLRVFAEGLPSFHTQGGRLLHLFAHTFCAAQLSVSVLSHVLCFCCFSYTARERKSQYLFFKFFCLRIYLAARKICFCILFALFQLFLMYFITYLQLYFADSHFTPIFCLVSVGNAQEIFSAGYCNIPYIIYLSGDNSFDFSRFF
jgi:hypothetical protein